MQRFYGGDPLGWAEMPSGWLNAFAHMYGRLRDEEMLREISAVSAASGTMQEGARRDMLNGLQRSVEPSAPKRRATVADLAAAGITVTES